MGMVMMGFALAAVAGIPLGLILSNKFGWQMPFYVIGGELSALITEHCFEYLDAPVMREGSLDTPVPMNADLEINFLPKERFKEKLLKLINY